MDGLGELRAALSASGGAGSFGRPGRKSGEGGAWVLGFIPRHLPSCRVAAGCLTDAAPSGLVSDGPLHPALSVQLPLASLRGHWQHFACTLSPPYYPQLPDLRTIHFLPEPWWSQDLTPPSTYLGGVTWPPISSSPEGTKHLLHPRAWGAAVSWGGCGSRWKRLSTLFEQVVQRGFPTDVTFVLVKALPEQRDPKAW